MPLAVQPYPALALAPVETPGHSTWAASEVIVPSGHPVPAAWPQLARSYRRQPLPWGARQPILSVHLQDRGQRLEPVPHKSRPVQEARRNLRLPPAFAGAADSDFAACPVRAALGATCPSGRRGAVSALVQRLAPVAWPSRQLVPEGLLPPSATAAAHLAHASVAPEAPEGMVASCLSQ